MDEAISLSVSRIADELLAHGAALARTNEDLDSVVAELKTEFDRRLDADVQTIDYEALSRGAAFVLGRRQDLRAAVWLALSVACRGWEEATAGVLVLQRTLTAGGQLLPPKRQARFGALDIFDEEFSSCLPETAPNQGQANALLEGLVGLAQSAQEILGEEAPALGESQRRVRELLTVGAVQAPLLPVEIPPAVVDAADRRGEIDIGIDIEQAAEVIFRRADQLRRAKPSDPWPYALVRRAAWMGLRTHLSLTVARIPPPHPSQISALETARRQGTPLQVVHTAEWILRSCPLWLDLQYFTDSALRSLGLAEASQAVQDELRGLLARVPGLHRAAFADGFPLASAGAREWMDSISPCNEGLGSRDGEVAAGAADRGEGLDLLGLEALRSWWRERRLGEDSPRELLELGIRAGKAAIRLGHGDVALEFLRPMVLLAGLPAEGWDPGAWRRLYETLGEALQAGGANPVSDSVRAALESDWAVRRWRLGAAGTGGGNS